jgi:DNA polymerase-1
MVSPIRLFLIDGSSQMYRAYHAMRGSGLSGPGGKSTHAVYIFVTMLRKLVADHQPQYIAASFDMPGPTFRSEMAADYKANRAPMPPDLAEQIPWVHEACEAMGVPILTSERFEADDVIGTLAVKAAESGYDVDIVTGDKDFFQLVHDGIKVYNPRDDGTWFDASGVKEKFGVTPEQVVDVLALMGDSIDNIKGVPGIGEKGARDLIATYGTLDNLLEHATEVSNKRYREGLLGHASDARQSRELARIRTDVPVSFDPEAFRYRGVRSASSCSRAWGSDPSCSTTRQPRRRSARTIRSSRLPRISGHSPPHCAPLDGLACACFPTIPLRCGPPSWGCRSRQLRGRPDTFH